MTADGKLDRIAVSRTEGEAVYTPSENRQHPEIRIVNGLVVYPAPLKRNLRDGSDRQFSDRKNEFSFQVDPEIEKKAGSLFRQSR